MDLSLRLFARKCDIGAGIGGVAQAGASIADTEATNAANIMMQQQAQKFNAGQAGIARDFARQQATTAMQFSRDEQLQAQAYNTAMSDTAMQRRVRDLKAAGINPLLGISAGAASSPQMSAPQGTALGGPAASSPQPPQLRGTDPMGIVGGLVGQSLAAAQTRKANAEASVSEGEAPYSGPRAAAQVRNLDAMNAQITQNIQTLSSQFDLNEANAAEIWQRKDFAAQMFPILKQIEVYNQQAKALGMPQLEQQAEFWKNPASLLIYAAQQGHLGGGDVGAAAATAAEAGYLNRFNASRRDSSAIKISDPRPGMAADLSSGGLEASGIGAPTP